MHAVQIYVCDLQTNVHDIQAFVTPVMHAVQVYVRDLQTSVHDIQTPVTPVMHAVQMYVHDLQANVHDIQIHVWARSCDHSKEQIAIVTLRAQLFVAFTTKKHHRCMLY